MLCLEVDENHHKYHIQSDEIMDEDLFMDSSGKYIFTRYNLDIYIAKHNKSKNSFCHNRLEALTLSIDKHNNRIENEENSGLVEIYQLFYDE